MNNVYLLLGSNIGNPEANLTNALIYIKACIGIVTKHSTVYKTAPWGNTVQPYFLNQVILVQTKLTANEAILKVFYIEAKMGRVRSEKNAPRIIDIDILFYNLDIVNEPGLIIPHPFIQDRKFVLIPLAEIAYDLVHPTLKKTIAELLKECIDELEVQKKL